MGRITLLMMLLVWATPLRGGEVDRPASTNLQNGGWIDPNTVECSGTRCRSYLTADTWFTLEAEEVCSYFGGDCRTLVRWVDENAWGTAVGPGSSVPSESPEPPAAPSQAARAEEPQGTATGTPPPARDDVTDSDAPAPSSTGSGSPSAGGPPETPSPGTPAPAIASASKAPSAGDLLRRAFEEGLGRLQREAGRLEGGLEIRPGAHGTGTAGGSGEEKLSGAFLEWQDRAERLLADPTTPPEALAASLGELSRLAEQGLGESAKPFQESIRRMVAEMAAAMELTAGSGTALAGEDGPWDLSSGGGSESDSPRGTRSRRVPAAYGEGGDATSGGAGSAASINGEPDPTAETLARNRDDSLRRAPVRSVASLLGTGPGGARAGAGPSARRRAGGKRPFKAAALAAGAGEDSPYSGGLLASLPGHRGSATVSLAGVAAAAGFFLLFFWRRRKRRR